MRIPDEIRRQLGPGEHLLWYGWPRRGLLLRRADAVVLPCGLAWLALGVHLAPDWSEAALPSRLLTVLCLLAGPWMACGRLMLDAAGRAATWYGVTGERIIIVSGVFARSVKSLNLAGLAAPGLVPGRAGTGTIVFGPPPLAMRFETIPQAAAVHALILGARRAS